VRLTAKTTAGFRTSTYALDSLVAQSMRSLRRFFMFPDNNPLFAEKLVRAQQAETMNEIQ
jgi:hypothetical protein